MQYLTGTPGSWHPWALLRDEFLPLWDLRILSVRLGVDNRHGAVNAFDLTCRFAGVYVCMEDHDRKKPYKNGVRSHVIAQLGLRSSRFLSSRLLM